MFLQFIKFCVVGGTGVVVDFGITFLFKEKLKLNKYIANSLGFMAAASTNYLLNRWWTFRRRMTLYWIMRIWRDAPLCRYPLPL